MSHAPSACTICGKEDNTLTQCQTCLEIHYCSPECRRSKKHTKPCKKIRAEPKKENENEPKNDLIPQIPDDAPFEIRSIEGKGMGMFATRDIKMGELIVKESPLVSVDRKLQSRHIKAAVQKLEPHQREIFFALSDSKSFSKNSKTAWGIFKTNAVPTGSSSIFPLYSRINHSCSPNAEISGDDGIRIVKAAAPIAAGQEICTQYRNTRTMIREERQHRLREEWGFACTCDVCSLTGKQLEKNDQDRMKAELISIWTFELMFSMLPRPLSPGSSDDDDW